MAKTARQMVVVVARKDLWKKRVQSNVAFLKRQYGEKLPADYSKEKNLPSIIIKKLFLPFILILWEFWVR
jgi:hypothetical protein